MLALGNKAASLIIRESQPLVAVELLGNPDLLEAEVELVLLILIQPAGHCEEEYVLWSDTHRSSLPRPKTSSGRSRYGCLQCAESQ